MSTQVSQTEAVELPANHIRTAFEITDINERYSQPHGQSIHIFEPGAETSLCGHVDEGAHPTSLATDADHEHSLVYDVAVCDHCTRSVRKRVREDELTTGHATLDTAIRADEGDDLVIDTPTDEYHITVEETGFRYGSVKIEASTGRDAPDGVEHWSDSIKVSVGPDGEVEVRHPYNLIEGPEETTGSVCFASEERPLVTDGGVAVDETESATHPEPVAPAEYGFPNTKDNRSLIIFMMNQKIHDYLKLGTFERPLHISPKCLPSGHNY